MDYPTLDDILAIHFRIVQETGGSPGVRDLNLLSSAIARPQTAFGGKDLYPDIFLKAAALAHSLLLNHPFFDGNKRTALIAMEYFLYLNNSEIKASQKEKIDFALWIENKKPSLEQISDWIKNHSNS